MNKEFSKAFAEIANGDESARQFCVVFFEFVHLLDDLADKDKARSPVEVVAVVCAALETFAANPFFQAHRDLLLGAIRVGGIAWTASESFRRREGVVDRMAAEVLKSGYQEVFFAVAAITGGMAHAAAMSEKYRGYEPG